VRFAIVVGVLGALVVVAAILLAVWPWINVVETGQTQEYPDLLPRHYRAGSERIFEAALQAVRRLSRWTLITSRPEAGEIQAEARTTVLRFVDDVRIQVQPTATASGGDLQARTVVRVRSASRVGRADFGQNARNIREFFGALDRQLENEEQRR
jgi:uncharacterized protein (DUF1499 family)